MNSLEQLFWLRGKLTVKMRYPERIRSHGRCGHVFVRERALVLLEETYKGHPKTSDLIVSFNKFADSALNIQVVHWWDSTDMKEYLAGMQEINLTIKERFDTEGISFAFPSQTVYLKQDSNWSLVQK